VDMNLLWSRIYDVIIKALLSVDTHITGALKKLGNKSNCFELFGFDILIDSDLKPWLLEVNLSPSLATDSPIDTHIKTNLMTDTFNLVGIRKFDRRRDNLSKMK
jgi:tubulin polyglutamylase TTLL5